MKKMTIFGIVLVVAIVSIMAFAIIFPESHNKSDDSLVVSIWAYGGEPSSLNPLDGWNLEQEPLIQSTLFKRNHDMDLVNDLAEGYSVGNDGKTYIVNIKNGVKFHDGSNLTSEDVAFTYNKAISSKKVTPDLSSLNETTAINNTTVQFVLNQPDSTFLSKLTILGIVPKESYNNETYATHPIGSGPFKFVQWDKGQQIILEKNDDYYGKKPNFKKLTIVYLQGEAALASASKGEVDIAEIPAELANRTINNMRIQHYSSVDPRGIALPTVPNNSKKSNGVAIGNNVTANLAIRKALNYGINREEIIKGVFYGYGTKTYDGVSTLLPWSNPDTSIKDGDINKSIEILNENGWKDTDGDGVVEKDGLKAEFDLVYLASDSQRQAMAVTVSEQAKKFGIKINPQGKSWNEMSNFKYSNGVILGYGSRDPGELKLDYYSKLAGESNIVSYSNPTVDKHIDSAIGAKNEKDSYSEWKSVLWDGSTGISPQGDSPWVWIACKDYVYAVRNNLDISSGTATVPVHGGDLFGNIYDWMRI
ncbi:MAG: ABC transporter substrate-binding protein [Methanobrevibacter sp.]|jgi:peptide/nickel transport system substrate-binding protein|nr:ABC transporter substrate-binding protein [Candidatus Methanovirga basalitermitum]